MSGSNEIVIVLLRYVVILYSLILHEVSHGTMALILGDTTAKDLGRLSLNPLRHLDPVGSFLVPIFSFIITGFKVAFGWAKPVPYDPFNLKNPLLGSALIALAGPVANFVLAFLFAMILRFNYIFNLNKNVFEFISFIVLINCLWGVFNLIPIPPFDGSKILFYFTKGNKLEQFLNKFSFALFLLIILFGYNIIIYIASLVFIVFTGMPPM